MIEIIVRKDNQKANKSPQVKVSRDYFSFNSAFLRQGNLTKWQYITFLSDTENGRLYFDFHNDRENVGAYKLSLNGGSKNNKLAYAASVIRDLKIRTEESNSPSFDPDWDGVEKKWFIKLTPYFSNAIYRKAV